MTRYHWKHEPLRMRTTDQQPSAAPLRKTPTLAEMNRRYREFWKSKGVKA